MRKEERISVVQLGEKLPVGDFLLVDVRMDTEFEIVALPGMITFFLQRTIVLVCKILNNSNQNRN